MIRKLAVALLGAGVLVPGLANALGLGEITNSSGLGQALNAKIELTQTRDLQPGEVKVSLASQKDFDAAGVNRDYALTDLVFDVVVKPDGKSYVTVRSRRPMNEPYVNFLVEVLWPQGRLLREYTVLLDPPLTSDARRQAVTAPVAAAASSKSSSSAGTSTSSTVNYNTSGSGKPTWKVTRATPGSTKSEPKPAAAPSESVASSAKPAAAPGAQGGEAQYGPTKSNDSLWRIATKLRPSGDVTVHQTMVALAKNNPEAFIAGNINLLKTGKTLQAPSASQAQEVSASDAIKEVARQNNAWREMIAGNKEGLKKALASQQIQGSDTSASAPPAATGPDGQLKLASSDTSSAAKSGAGGGGAALESKLTATEENLDKSARENQDLKSHLTSLQDQVAQSEKVLKLKDDQIAAMQAKMAQLEQEVAKAKVAGSTAASVAPAATAPAVSTAPAQQPDYNYQPQPPAQPAAPEVAAPAPEPVKPPVPVAAVPEPQQAAPAAEPTKAAPAEPAKTDASSLSQIPPAILYGAPAALIVVLLLLFTRKKKDEAPSASAPAFSMPEPVAEQEETEPAEAPEPVKAEAPAVQAAAPVSADPISEADIYIAYRQFPRAVDVLEKAITREPGRADLRLKLLEVLVETGDKSGFERHEAALAGMGDTSAKVRAAELRSTLFGHAGQPAETVSDEDLNFTTDESAFDHIAEFDSAETAPVVQDKTLDDLGLDFALDLDQTLVQPAAPAPAAAPSAPEPDAFAPLEFTLDDSFASEPVQAEPVAAAPVIDNALDFDLNFDTTSVAEMPADASTLTLSEEGDLAFEPVAEELSATLPVLEESHIAEPSTAADFSLDFETPAETEAESPLLTADEPILMPSVADETIHDEGDFAFDPMTGEFEPSVKAAQALSAPTAEEAEDLDFLAGSDEISTKLDLARAYIDMGDREGAKDILDEVVVEGNDSQKAEARELLSRLEA